MSLRSRPMLPKDVDECAGIVAKHPVIGRRYGPAINDLQPAWLRLLRRGAMLAPVYEEVNGTAIRVCGFGVGVFVSEDFMREVKTPPLFWFGPKLATRIMRGRSPVLSSKDVREANSGPGLNLLVWEATPRPEFANRPDLYHIMADCFIELYRGFRLNEMITSQSESAERLQWAVDAGGYFWNAEDKRYTKSIPGSPEKFCQEPHIVGTTRELEFDRPGSLVGSLFYYHPPQFGFSRGEQRLLLAALSGATDEKLAEQLGLSPSTVKNTWRSIYNRAASRMPELVLNGPQDDSRNSERGKEKKRHLLAYLREHAEELRPYRANSPGNARPEVMR